MVEQERLEFEHAGKGLSGEVFRPEGARGPLPAVLVMASAYGLGEHVRSSARDLAGCGFIAVATDMYGAGAFHAEPKNAGPDYAALMADPALLRDRVAAWYAAAKGLAGVDPERVAAIGYCFGGYCVLELARSGADVKAVVSFHGTLKTDSPAQPGAVTGEVVAWCGAQDPYAPSADIEALGAELRAAGARHQITVFSDVAHSFTDRDADKHGMAGIAYHPLAHRVSWAGTLALLGQVLQVSS